MRKFAVVLLVIGFAQVSAFAGVIGAISFDPDKATVDRSQGDSEIVKFDVFLGDLGDIGDAFGSFDFVMGSNDGLQLTSFELDAGVLALTSPGFPPSILDNQRSDIYLDDIQVAAFLLLGAIDTSGGPARIGSLTVDTTGLAESETPYQVIVDANFDQQSGANNGPTALLFGTASVNVIPEPATISLLGLASLALIPRRKKA